MRRLQLGETSVVVGTDGPVRPVFVQRPRAKRPKLVGHVVRDPHCNCARPHRWRAIGADQLDLYRRILTAWQKEPTPSNRIALEVVAGPKFPNIETAVRVLVDGPSPALTAAARREYRRMGLHPVAHAR